jgi:hypothetical protein
MRSQRSARLLRVALFAVFAVCTWACQAPSADAPRGQLADFASGVDAEFGVETFALSTPTLAITSPKLNEEYVTDFTIAGPVKVNVCLSPSDYDVGTAAGQGKILCYLDGATPLTTATLLAAGDPSGCQAYKITFANVAQKLGMHAIECYLADASSQKLTNSEAHAVTHFYVTGDPLSTDAANKCGSNEDCDDSNACSQQICAGGTGVQCVYSYVPQNGCCNNSLDCNPGDTCLNPNTPSAICSSCKVDGDCDDTDSCTTDTCDLSGTKGVCKNVKADPECCTKPTDLCDDGNGCTLDSCDTTAQKCKHVQSNPACCQLDTDCTSADKCLVGSCVDLECRFGKDIFKPDCCTAPSGTNAACDDKNPCTIDKCDISQGGWTQCSHNSDPSKPKCCDLLNSTKECDDGNACTQDVCQNFQCQNNQISTCCTQDIDCADNDLICTVDTCVIPKDPNGVLAVAGDCSHVKPAGCCVQPADCNDGKQCTLDACNLATHQCKFTKVDLTCCDTSDECNDSNICTADACVNNACVHGPDANFPNCCVKQGDCDDKNPCTLDTCDTAKNQCVHISNGDPACCATQLDCGDGDCTTLDYCGTDNKCAHKPYPELCSLDAQCDDGDACTNDSCDKSTGCGQCKHDVSTTCCSAASQCDDSVPTATKPANPKAICTQDLCTNGACQNPTIAGCCVDDADALTTCDDGNGCTIDYCSNNQCRHTTPKGGCCASTKDCNDGDACTTDTCANISATTKTGTCTHTVVAGQCVCTTAGVFAGTDCNDQNKCTTDSCNGGKCAHAAIADCCVDKFDCNDGNACTADYCIQDTCLHYTSVGGSSVCCSAATQDVDCSYLNTECAKGVCADQADGSKKCEAQQVPICTVNIGYCQDFSTGASLSAMGWNPGNVKGTAAKNWLLAKDGGLGPDQHAKFTWTPTTINYQTCLQSPIIQAAGATTITMQFDREFTWNQGETVATVYGSLDGANVDWTTATQIDVLKLSGDLAAETVDFKLPAELSGSNGLRLGLCLSGTSTFNLTSFALDNVCVVKGNKPVFSKCPVNQVVPLGTTVSLPVKAYDPDSDAILSFSLVKAPSFVTLSSALYYWLDTSWNTTLTIAPSDTSHIGTWPITLKVSDGSLYSTCTFDLIVTYKGGYLVWRPSEVPVAAGNALYSALKAKGKIAQQISDLGLYPDLSGFQGVFVSLGVYPNNHVLTDSESKPLALYLAQSGHVYMEGGDTWAFDPQTTLHALFKVLPQADTAINGITGPLAGLATPYKDVFQSPLKIYGFAYDQGFDWNNLNDLISGKTAIHRTKDILGNTKTSGEVVQVGHDDDTGYRTVASSILLGGVLPGPDDNVAMMARVLDFFDNGFVECAASADCDDSNACTADACTAGECTHVNACSCTASASMTCGDTSTLTSNGSGSTNQVTTYSCDATNTKFTGSEIAVKFATDTSGPVSLTVTGMTNPAAKVFVLKGNSSGCDPTACLTMGDATKPITFSGAVGATYYVVLDVPAGGTGQASVAFSCGAGENCTNGKDDNGNGLIDCADLLSCCGDPACGEVCDGLDNNCDGKIDEGCDDDADGFCDGDITVVGTPPICPNGGLDCNDTQATVNPASQEICNNGKDDNCSGSQNEENAIGCVKYWSDLDADGYGGGSAKCLCASSGAFTAKKGGDCNDANAKVNPAATEICGNGIDDDCSGTQNDINAQGCSDFYTDTDLDAWGTLPKKCLCTGEGLTTATKPGDCNDASSQVNPDAPEVCNNADDNCNNVIDEGCDDDVDGYCDINLGYVTIGGSSIVCGQGAIGGSLTVGCTAGMTITSVDFASYGNPTGACGGYKLGTCTAPSSLQAIKNLCLGKTSCQIDVSNGTFGGDPCATTTKILDVQVTCTGNGGVPPDICPKGPGDTDDNDPNINPNGKEICDGKDNNSDGKTDEGCDDDGDGFCDAAMIVVGVPTICPKTKSVNGKGDDCADDAGSTSSATTPAKVNPGVGEDCATATDDDNCDGNLNEINAKNCVVFFKDVDKDGYGTSGATTFQCQCSPGGAFTAKKTADCDDTNAQINPGMAEGCNNLDDNCDAKTDEGCDVDGDGYCNANLVLAAGVVSVCPNGGNDCDDTTVSVNPSKAEICGNGIDDNCNGSQNDAGAVGCVTYYSDADSDSFGTNTAKCLCDPSGTFKTTINGDCNDGDLAINPLATEVCDGKDNDCNGSTDEGCDDDGDKYCDSAMVLVGSPAVCVNGGGDCVDTNAAIHPTQPESCDDVDQNCDGVTDNGCDDDGDGYCDAAYTVKNPLPKICPKGTGDCDDLNNDQNPGAPEVCGNGIDDNCNGSQNDAGATNCTKFFFDGDSDAYGLNISQCLCVAAGSYKAPQGNDCDDTNTAVNPGATEVCGDGIDNNCNVDQNDPGATGCKTFYFDSDADTYGLTALTKCLCVAADSYTAVQGGDCNDLSAVVNPGKPEICDNIDNNCNGQVDEQCDKDGDKYCDSTKTVVGLPNACPFGGLDCNDNNANANPGFAEQCDNIDNNCNSATDEGCNADGDTYCTVAMKVIGTPTICSAGAGDCNDSDKLVNPAVNENCATTYDDNCNGDTNDVNATGCTTFGQDLDGDTYYDKNIVPKCVCKASGTSTGTKPNDCNDQNNLVNPAVPELCDGIDNNCNGAVDEGCDADKDGYCTATMITIGKPVTCPKGGNDCDDANVNINPGMAENCATAFDDNCNTLTNEIGALGCSNFYLDGDNDGWAVNVAQCLCIPAGAYKLAASKVGDCDDTKATVNPSVAEVCGDNVDNNCNGTQNDVGATGCVNFYMDGDKDGFGVGAPQCVCFAQGLYITPLNGDCDDTNKTVSPGLPELCDNFDNNCSGATDEGCDDDADKYCDSAFIVVGTPTVCTKGPGDCNDTAVGVNPGMVETCDNVDQNCDGTTDNGCDDDKDGYCDKGMTVVGTPTICTSGGNDCDDGNGQINPGKTEICDDLDNNCNSQTDELCDKDLDKYCDINKTVIGTPAVCNLGGGDCNDSAVAINPGAAEICDNIDNNCAGGTDEVCKDTDGDGYCVGNTAISLACPKGGKDCDDTNKFVNPGAIETCATQYDDNCDGLSNVVGAVGCKNFYTDVDGDSFGIGSATCQCIQVGTLSALVGGDCKDTDPNVKPTAIEICDGIDNNCNAAVDEGCDDDNDGYCDAGMLITSTALCGGSTKPAVGKQAPGDDCNDTAATVKPNSFELCDNLDNNCNSLIDEGCDDDHDGWCDSAMTVVGTPAVCPTGKNDCNDQDKSINPAAKENCTTTADDNCNGSLNELNALGCTTFYTDSDGDGYGVLPSQCVCGPLSPYNASKNGDCDDTKASVYPNAAAEICDGADNDCNGVTDEGCDIDGDGYCSAAMTVTKNNACPKTVINAALKGDDCVDTDKLINPSVPELCDDVDNNCNAQIDEQCDKDGDKFCDSAKQIVGTPAVCINGGGDCNDSDIAVNPATAEVCNGKDDNCNKIVDEINATGCTTWYYDGDQDGVGVNSSQCLCGATGLYSSKSNNDCDDACPTCKPGGTESCDGKDNDCDGSVDPGCNADGDGYCTAAKVTIGTPPVCPKGGGDCNDSNGSINPGAAELCNNVDENCNGQTDEGAGGGCPLYANANTICQAGQCVIGSCQAGFYNLNGGISDGCECNGSDFYEPNNTCGSAYVLDSNLTDFSSGNGSKDIVAARLVDSTDDDWYAFYGADGADSGTGVCDAYNVRVTFVANPGGLAFDVTRGGCPNGSNTVCCGQTDFNWFTDFKGASNGDPSRQYSEYGECPCNTNGNVYAQHSGWNIPPGYPGGGGPYCMNYNSGYVCIPTGFYYTNCQDDSAWYYVHVYKVSGGPVCSSYKLEISNGIYGQPGTGNGYH